MNEKLKPCPFCGQTKPLGIFPDGEYYQVFCDVNEGGCGASSGVYKTKQGAIEAWNRRSNLLNEIPSDFRCKSCGGKISLVFGSYRMDGWEVEYYKCPDCDVPYLKIVHNQETD